MNSDAALAMLLLAGHLTGDFLLQKTAVAKRKNEFLFLLRHGLESYLALVAILWPFWSGRVLAGLLVLIALHLVIDAWKARARSGIATFLLDQGLHFLALTGCWGFLVTGDLPDLAGDRVMDAAYSWYVWGILLVGLTAFNLRGGCTLVRLALATRDTGVDSMEDRPGQGEIIGYLERMLVMVSVIAGQWSVVGLVMAAKSIARFKELDSREFAEYYLVGTLTSLLVAVVVGGVASWARGLCFGI
jgi:hypothetical protein